MTDRRPLAALLAALMMVGAGCRAEEGAVRGGQELETLQARIDGAVDALDAGDDEGAARSLEAVLAQAGAMKPPPLAVQDEALMLLGQLELVRSGPARAAELHARRYELAHGWNPDAARRAARDAFAAYVAARDLEASRRFAWRLVGHAYDEWGPKSSELELELQFVAGLYRTIDAEEEATRWQGGAAAISRLRDARAPR